MDVPRALALVQTKPPAPASPVTANTVLWIMMAVGALFFVVVVPRLRRRRTAPPLERPGTFTQSADTMRDELERLLAEIQDLSREQIARLDTKIRLLSQLLLECDQKKKELETLLGRAVGAGLSKLEPLPPPRPANPLHDQVYALRDSGKNVLDICAATGLESGEVELILGLRKMQR